MSRRRHRKPGVPPTRKRGRLHFRPAIPPGASPALALGTQLRINAEASECCVCGARPTYFEVTSWNPKDPKVRQLDGPPGTGLAHAVYVHRHDCPAASDEVETALAGPST